MLNDKAAFNRALATWLSTDNHSSSWETLTFYGNPS